VGLDQNSPLQTLSRLNMTSAEEHPMVILEYLVSEFWEGRVLGPLDPGQFTYVHHNQFGVVPKSPQENKANSRVVFSRE